VIHNVNPGETLTIRDHDGSVALSLGPALGSATADVADGFSIDRAPVRSGSVREVRHLGPSDQVWWRDKRTGEVFAKVAYGRQTKLVVTVAA
jgi:hypothetical protein